MNFRNILIILLTVMMLDLSWVFAKSPDVTDLEKTVRAKHEMSEVIRKLSELRSFESWPEDTDPLLKLLVAVRWMEQGWAREAARLLDRTLPVSPYEDLRQLTLLTALLEINELARAQAILAALEKSSPENPDVLFLKSSVQAQSQDLAGAIKTLTEVIEKHSGYGKAYLQRGMLYIHSFSHELAMKDLDKAIRKLPQTEVRYRQMAFFQAGLLKEKFYFDPKGAKKYFKSGEKLNPRSKLAEETRLQSEVF